MATGNQFEWLFDTSTKNILRHIGGGAATAIFLAGWLALRGIPSTGAVGGPLIGFACGALYGLGWGGILAIRRLLS